MANMKLVAIRKNPGLVERLYVDSDGKKAYLTKTITEETYILKNKFQEVAK